MHKATFRKAERLKHKRVIEVLFERGKTYKDYPLVLTCLKCSLHTPYPAQTAVTVSKRRFKKAVDRNRIKRLMRESWRKQKQPLYAALEQNDFQLALVFIYVGKDLPTQNQMDVKISALTKRLIEDIPNFPLSHSFRKDSKDAEETS
ncbi:MAG: ribonuclease P protein component [Flavobacteriales bacterium]|nr:ribonuclease P protein component [Flavobacteriales bacterium]